MARCQQARSWERRATLSLSRLWQQQGKQETARTLLEEARGELTEGGDMGASEEAKALPAEGERKEQAGV